MQFVKVEGWGAAVQALTGRLWTDLSADRRVLWLIPGGSNIDAAVSIMESLPTEATRRLTIMLTDERFGPVGHKDSNMQQLIDAGFAPKRASVLPVLAPGLSLAETCQQYRETFANALAKADVAIGQFGIGTDGHIAGILPGSPAASSEQLACGYETPTFTRVTLTFPALTQLSCAYAFVFGDDKHDMLETLQQQNIPLDVQPSQVLKQLPSAYVFNDHIGEEA